MERGRKFTIGIAENGIIYLREHAVKNPSEEETHLRIIYPVDKDLTLIDPHVLIDDKILSLDDYTNSLGVSKSEVLRSNDTPLVYPTKELTYIVEHSIWVENGKFVRGTVSIFLPFDVYNRHSLVCRDVSLNFQPQVRKTLVDKYSAFVQERL